MWVADLDGDLLNLSHCAAIIRSECEEADENEVPIWEVFVTIGEESLVLARGDAEYTLNYMKQLSQHIGAFNERT